MILALDIGQHLGWVLGNAVGPVRYGTAELSATTNLGAFVRSMDAPLQALIPRATAIAVEKPFTAGNAAYFAIRKNMAGLAMIHYWANFYGLAAPTEISVMTGKLTLSGSGNADKARMIAAAEERGYPGMNEHEADALGIWWVYVFGKQEPIRKPHSRSSKGVVITQPASANDQ